MPPAHTQRLRLRGDYILWYPAHAPRKEDPHYADFNRVKRRLHRLDVGCWRCGVKPSDIKRSGKGKTTDANPHGAKQIEIHHFEVEFAFANAVDVEEFERIYPQHTAQYHIRDTETFLAYVESEGNCQVLCDYCHRSPVEGIHGALNYPLWKLEPVERKGLPTAVTPNSE